MTKYVTTKTYTHEVGLSCCFRQWRAAPSHCAYLHGYALSVALHFDAVILDHRNWVVDFGGLKDVKEWLQATFDHTLIAAADDPYLPQLQHLASVGVCDLRVLPSVGCEAFARHIFRYVEDWLVEQKLAPRVSLRSVTVSEHGGNECSYER